MNILTFDIEEWFHILDNDSTKTEKEWNNFESRIHANMNRIFEMLDKLNIKATFFCLGWIAEKYPEIIREIDRRGYEVACHSSRHQLIYEQTPVEFKEDLLKSLKILENITGKKVVSYRAPGFSLTENCKWAFDILAEAGIKYDSSVFPAQRFHGGFPSFPGSEPAFIEINGSKILEFPINVIKVAGKNIVFSGGGYFRFFPYWLIKYWTHQSPYLMTYLHPRDFDATQPTIEGLSFPRRFRTYYGIKSARLKFEKWTSDFDFLDIQSAIQTIDLSKIKTVQL